MGNPREDAEAEVKRLAGLISRPSALPMPDWKYGNLRADYALALRRLRDLSGEA